MTAALYGSLETRDVASGPPTAGPLDFSPSYTTDASYKLTRTANLSMRPVSLSISPPDAAFACLCPSSNGCHNTYDHIKTEFTAAEVYHVRLNRDHTKRGITGQRMLNGKATFCRHCGSSLWRVASCEI